MPVSSRRGSWDFTLMMASVAVLSALGVQSFLGTLYSWWAYRAVLDWESVGYPAFLETMNAIAAPQVVALVLLLGLCVPKRVFERRVLVVASAALLGAGVAAWAFTGSLADGLAAYVLLAGAFQAVVLALTIAGSPALTYLTEGRVVRIGSGLLHLGFLAFAYVVVALQDSTWMLPVFWFATMLLVAGSAMSFYARPLARFGRPT